MTKPGQPAPGKETSQRLDKWLWFARLAKSRTLAATAVVEGKIKVNRVKAEKASQTVKVGDVITSRLRRTVRVLKIAGLGERRGPAAEAQLLYEDLTPPAERNEQREDAGSWGERTAGSGRPTKRDRRQIEELKRSGS
ncbi:RNA-binding S4 domain-containing protein [Hyphomicrobium sp. CS1GBMeth3]|uniref:RNA-binding S4 domain-containing protein n=1 Tax=Hyphomicrobium sp. CS1GBMeth3 TaxID=1892845 RepID=UPI000931CDD7|nr:RNA-binding S4 domain-containing protein [Hyphomicrobium sp. CS1GBMeth3]